MKLWIMVHLCLELHVGISLKGMVTKLVEPYGRLENDPVLYQHLSEDWEYSVSVKYFSLTMDVNCF